MSAMAASVGINGKKSFSSLEKVVTIAENIVFLGKEYSVFGMYDPLYPEMDMMYCLGPSKTYPEGKII